MHRRGLASLLLAAAFTASAAGVVHARPVNMTAQPQPNATTCKMTYPATNGGALIQHVKVFDVFYSTGNAYETMLADFYTAITQSAHFDMLSEYNIGNYKISRGSYVGKFVDTNANPATPKALDPQAYLQGLITAKKVPAPDDDTIYMIYFPSGIDPLFIDGTTHSCITARTYCAYHSSFLVGSQIVRFSVMPDVNAGMCAGGCGMNATPFQNLTDVSSHELIEAVTDPDNNTAWVDRNNSCTPTGEIGDICAVGGAGEVGVVAGFTVQKEWSNALKACVVVNPNVVINDFTLAVAPTTVNVPIGGSATVTATLTKTTGAGESVALTAMAPTGVTAALAPTSVSSAGGTSMITISAAATATAGGTDKVVVKAAGTTVSQSATITINYVSPPDMATAPIPSQPAGGDGTGGTGSGGSAAANNDKGGGGCSMLGGGDGGAWALGALMLALAAALRRRRA
jgi:MYXO-CTERM domain-containing protein